MKLLIVSGLSGSGKSIALDTLEDCGYYCIDNLPVTLLEDFISHVMLLDKSTYEKTAIGIDARNQSDGLAKFPASLEYIRNKGIECQVFFMQADESALLKRYSETRRRHPLTSHHELSLKEAIDLEKVVLKTVAAQADLVIDTSRTQYHQLRELIKAHLDKQDGRYLSLQFQSFGYKNGMPLDADFAFDARCLPNPYWDHDLRGMTGNDQPVIVFLQSEDLVQNYFHDVATFLELWIPRFERENRSYLTVAIGCTGGQHRSVYLVNRLAEHFKKTSLNVITQHRDLQ